MRTYVILDKDDNRRTAVYRAFARERSVVPVTSPGELGSVWPVDAWFLVHDDDELLADLQSAFATRGRVYPILVYGEELVPGRIVAAVYGGAIDYVQWPNDVATIEATIDRAADLAVRRCERASGRLAAQARLAALSSRELEVLKEMRNGLTNKEIARVLNISSRTVEIHRSNAISKVGARNTAEATWILFEAEDSLTSEILAA